MTPLKRGTNKRTSDVVSSADTKVNCIYRKGVGIYTVAAGIVCAMAADAARLANVARQRKPAFCTNTLPRFSEISIQIVAGFLWRRQFCYSGNDPIPGGQKHTGKKKLCSKNAHAAKHLSKGASRSKQSRQSTLGTCHDSALFIVQQRYAELVYQSGTGQNV